ncbi:hypothetical protein Tco_0474570 [Tanacetum coccineum]
MIGGAWRDIVKVREDLEGIGIGYTSSLKGVVGNGREIGFWVDKWLGDVRLCDRFLRLYHLDRRKEAKVVDRGRWVNNELCWEWEWVKELRGMVCRDFNELVTLLQNVVLAIDCRDQWKWTLQEDGVFTIKALIRMVEEKTFKGRLSVREELDKSGIDLDSTLCPCFDSVVELCIHSLVLRNFSTSVWEKVFSWWKLGSVNAISIGELFSSNGNVDIPNCSILL